MLHLFMEGGRFQPEAIVAMRAAYEASLKELRDSGQPKLVLEIIAERIIGRLGLVSAIRFACEKPRCPGLPAERN
jgi:hypothetical protein